MERFIWEGSMIIDDTICLQLDDTGDSYTDKDYVGPTVGYVFVEKNDSITFMPNENCGNIIELKSRQGRLMIEFKKRFKINQLRGGLVYYSDNAYQKVSNELNREKEKNI